MKAFSYINLDGIVAGNYFRASTFANHFIAEILNTYTFVSLCFFSGQSTFKVAASPLMYTLVERTLNEVINSCEQYK